MSKGAGTGVYRPGAQGSERLLIDTAAAAPAPQEGLCFWSLLDVDAYSALPVCLHPSCPKHETNNQSMQAKKRPAANDAAVPAAPSQLHQMAGYFAIVGMSRLQCLLGDYYECECTR